jgi:hypothetical protein
MHKDSIYTSMLDSSDKVINGYNHNNGMVDKFFSNRMSMNPMMEGFIKSLDPWFIKMMDCVRRIQFTNNYTADKNDKTIHI